MTLPETNKTYINWKDYIFFRDYLERLKTIKKNSNDIDNFIKHKSVPLYDVERHNFINICHEIRELFRIMSSNDTYDNRKCCNYINYYIRHQIKENFPTKEYEIFEHFKNYVESNIKDQSYKKCVPEIKYIGEAEFDKMNELIELYDHYETNLYPTSVDNNGPSIDCKDLNDFIEDYNEKVQKHMDDIPFHKELNNLRCSIENNELFNDNCESTLRGISKNEHYPSEIKHCDESLEKEYLKKYTKPTYSYFSTNTYIQPTNMKDIIAITLSSFTTARNYLRNRFPRMRRMNRNKKEETYQHEMYNRKHYHRDLKEKCYNVLYVSERKY
ncbi:variable surface protein [Plasmodium gonderi]|uniref:Variable surface protein n=1 Tax=Plasmodium gonderi TaxID=77519 RepID=A0A1Y1JQB0_PLAGO|nr:variable surface protein [Plasmodium gonderi]GAW84619.1 variable surface protein [Plasmodium gonderi]